MAEAPPTDAPAPATGSIWSDEGLVEVPGTTAAGGMHVPLQGRYRTSIVMRRNADGTVSTQCIANPSAAADRD